MTGAGGKRATALIELLCALTIFIITTTIYIELTNRKQISFERATRYTRAVEMTDAWASRCRAMTAAQLDRAHGTAFSIKGLSPRDGQPAGKISVTGTGRIRLVTVTVRWQGARDPRPLSVSMQTQVVR